MINFNTAIQSTAKSSRLSRVILLSMALIAISALVFQVADVHRVRFTPLTDTLMEQVIGSDQHKYADGATSCDLLQIVTDQIQNPTFDFTDADSCTSSNTGYICISCGAGGTNAQISVLTDNNNLHPPGLILNATVSCGNEWAGACADIGGGPICYEYMMTEFPCSSVQEWFNQPPN